MLIERLDMKSYFVCSCSFPLDDGGGEAVMVCSAATQHQLMSRSIPHLKKTSEAGSVTIGCCMPLPLHFNTVPRSLLSQKSYSLWRWRPVVALHLLTWSVIRWVHILSVFSFSASSLTPSHLSVYSGLLYYYATLIVVIVQVVLDCYEVLLWYINYEMVKSMKVWYENMQSAYMK